MVHVARAARSASLTMQAMRSWASRRYADSGWFRLIAMLVMIAVNWLGLTVVSVAVPPDAWFLPCVAIAWMLALATATTWFLMPSP